jgi:hypothetical protein
MTADDAYRRLEVIRPEVSRALAEEGSEQDARLKIINRILTEVLSWQYDQIRTEPHTANGFADYCLSDGDKRNVAVLEAKRTGKLIVDTASASKTEVKLGGQVLRPAADGIAQATDYCAQLGTFYSIVTDGSVWIFFRATRTDGIPPKEGKAIVFPSFKAVLDDFPTFYELLAPEAIAQRLHIARLNAAEGVRVPSPESRYYVKPSDEARLQSRTDIGRDVSEVFNRFFAEISSDHDPEMRKVALLNLEWVKRRGG